MNKVQLKTFYTTSLEVAESQANNWLTHQNVDVVSVNFTTTPEPSSFYSQNNYPGFKYALMILYRVNH